MGPTLKELNKLIKNGITLADYKNFNKSQLEVEFPLYLASRGYFVVMITPFEIIRKNSKFTGLSNENTIDEESYSSENSARRYDEPYKLVKKMRRCITKNKIKGFHMKTMKKGEITHESGGRIILRPFHQSTKGYHSDVLILVNANLMTDYYLFIAHIYPISFKTKKCLICGKPLDESLFKNILNRTPINYKLNFLKKDFID